MAISIIAAVLGSGIVRSFTGWFENAVEDWHFSKIELMQLGATIVRCGMLTFLIYEGTDTSALNSASIGVLIDFILSKLNLKEVLTAKKK